MAKKKQEAKLKEPVRIRFKQLANGNQSIYLDYYTGDVIRKENYVGGKRQYEFLKLYLIPEKTREDKAKNETTLALAKAIQSKRIVELQNDAHGFQNTNKSKANVIDYLVNMRNQSKERGSLNYEKTIGNTIRELKLFRGDYIAFRDIDKDFLSNFVDFLKQAKKASKYGLAKAGGVLSNNSVVAYYGVLRTALNKAFKERIMRLAGLPTDKDRDDFIFVVLRECTPDKRKQIIDYMLANMEDIGLVIIDGIRDLMYDINSPSESSELINLLMKWSSEYNLHIHTVLHLNKGDDNTRGHIGTELNNKAETVLQVTKSTQDVNISEVKAMHIRDKDFEPFAFRINDSALPEIAEDYIFEQPKQDRSFPLTELTELQHREALTNGFGKQVIQGYPKVIAALKEGYASIGFERGRNVLVKLNKFLVNKRMLVKEGKGYKYNPDFHY